LNQQYNNNVTGTAVKLYGRKTSINVQKASWVLGEAGLDFDWIDKEGKPGSIDTPDYRKLNPQVRVPTLDDDGIIVRQSNVIVRYIARKYANSDLLPDDPAEAAEAEYWMDWQAVDNWRNMVAVFWNLYRVPPEQRNDDEVAKGIAGLVADFEFLDTHLGDNAYVAGDDFSIGDISVGAAVHRFYVLPIDRPELAELDAYYEKLQQRPAFAENVMVPMP
jgi:glutathione S-transferase